MANSAQTVMQDFETIALRVITRARVDLHERMKLGLVRRQSDAYEAIRDAASELEDAALTKDTRS